MNILNNIITLATDFGIKDPFAGIMKGVMLNINGSLNFIDISHHIEPQNILQAVYVVQQSFSYFPAGTIHTVIVDPGVGTKRRAIIAQTEKYYFVAPDNGTLSAIFQLNDLIKVVEITEKKYLLKDMSFTFHGRDLFAPVSAWLSKGESIENFGREITDYKRLHMPQPENIDSGTIKGEVIYKDRFGNLITNINEKFIRMKKGIIMIKISDIAIDGLKMSYAESRGGVSALINSWSMLEIFLPNKNASKEFSIETGETVEVYFG